jgi:hypothetical protein
MAGRIDVGEGGRQRKKRRIAGGRGKGFESKAVEAEVGGKDLRGTRTVSCFLRKSCRRKSRLFYAMSPAPHVSRYFILLLLEIRIGTCLVSCAVDE